MKTRKFKLPQINWQKLKPHKPKLRKKSIIILAVNAALIIALIICAIAYKSTGNVLLDQAAVSRWAGDSELRYAQITCFTNATTALTPENLHTFETTVEAKMIEASIEAPETGSLWSSAYSAESTLTVKGSYGSSSANAFGVGGNFFLFHPLPLRSGSYFASDDLMDDRVLIDEELAWRIFGSVDLEGLTLTIDEMPFYIAGVISREDDKFNTKAYGEDSAPRIYLSYAALYRLNETPITCYELAVPNPISEYALTMAKESFPLGANGEVIENTGRFDLEPTISNLINFGSRTIQSSELSYPYWENAARLVENQLALLVLFIFIFALFPLACFIYLIVKEIRHVKHYFKKHRKDI